MLQAEHLTRRIGDTHLLDDVSLTVEPGQRMGLVGDSGSGKSTLMRALVMLDPCDTGTISFAGRMIYGAAVPGHRRMVGYVNQRPAMIDGTVEDNLRLPFEVGAYDHVFNRELAAEMLVELGRLPGLVDQDARKISGGEQQSVSLVRTLLAGPQLLLLDEPTASLDPRSTESLERFLTNWINLDASRSWIWSSHDAEQISRMTDRVLTMNLGKINP